MIAGHVRVAKERYPLRIETRLHRLSPDFERCLPRQHLMAGGTAVVGLPPTAYDALAQYVETRGTASMVDTVVYILRTEEGANRSNCRGAEYSDGELRLIVELIQSVN